MSGKEFAALAVPVLLGLVLLEEGQRWVCRFCGYSKNSKIREFCDRCHREDLEQGE